MSSSALANALCRLQVSFPLCQYAWCRSRTALHAGHTLLDLLKDCPRKPSGTGVSQGMPQISEQSRAQISEQSIPAIHPRARAGRAQNSRLAWVWGMKGESVAITGQMRPSGDDIRVPGATLLSEVKKSKSSWLPNLSVLAALCTFTLVVWITRLYVSLHQDMLE